MQLRATMMQMNRKMDIQHKLHIDLPKDLFALLTNRLLFRLGFGLVGVFLPIFFYQLFDNSIYTLLGIYIILAAASIPLVPLGAKMLGAFGIRKLLFLAIPFAVVSIAALYYAEGYPVLAVSAYIVSAILYKTLYWVPYHTDLAHLIGHHKVGAHIAIYKNVLQVINALTPLAGGVLIAMFGFSNIFVFAAAVLLATIVPTRYICEIYERYEWGFIETFKHLFAIKNRALLYAYTADGAQSIISAVVWPVFIFELLDGNYMSVGFVTSLTIIVILALNVVVGKFIDKVGDEKMLKYSTILATTGWIVKIFVDSAFQIFITDTYHRLGRAANRMSFDASTYEHAADNGHYVDEFTTLKEIALNIGRVLMLITVALLVYYIGNIRVIFVLAAGATLFMVMLNKQLNVK